MDKFIKINKINKKGEKINDNNLKHKTSNINNFIHKYTPKTIDNFQLPSNLKILLKNIITTNNFNIMLIGNSGTGKTTLLKTLINQYYGYNSFTYNTYCEDVLYINSLSDNGINYYRNEVKTFCSIPSKSINKKKMIVIDDIDSVVNEQCQQILRNFIDKYGDNVIFIMSCCNIQHIIDALQSRFNIIRLETITNDGMYNICNQIIVNENINITKEAKDFLIKMCNNSVSTLINYMEKIKLLDENINIDNIKSICCIISYNDYETLTSLIFNNIYTTDNLKLAVAILNDMINSGYSVIDILDNYFNYIKSCEIINEDIKYKIVPIISKYIVYFSNYHEDDIELYFFIVDLYDIISPK